MLITVFSPKGGSGTTTCAALIAKSFSQQFSIPTVLIDAYDGDVETVVGVDSESEYGFIQWTEAKDPTANNLARIATSISDNFSFVSYSSVKNDKYNAPAPSQSIQEKNQKAAQLVEALSNNESNYVIDIGTNVNESTNAIIEASDIVVMVIKGCYISLNRASSHPYSSSADSVIVLSEPGRTITSKQICDVLRIKCVIEIEARRDFAKCIDAGILIFRTPKNMIGAIDQFVFDLKQYLNRNSKQNIDQELALTRNRNFDRSEELVNGHLDIFDDTKQKNKRDFWQQEENLSARQKKVVSKPVDITYTSHLHNALSNIKNTRGER